MGKLIDYILREWRVIKGAPFAFITLLLVGWIVIIFALEWLHREKIEAVNIRTDHLSKLVEEYREKAGETPDLAKGKLEELIEKVGQLRQEAATSLEVRDPEWKKNDKGEWVVTGWFLVRSKFARTGLVIGVASDNHFKANVGNRGVLIGGEYKNQSAWTELGSYRYYIKNPSGAYFLTVTMPSTAPITIRHVFEGEKEGPIVIWQISKP